MKKLITICAVLCVMLSLTCVSWASIVTSPTGTDAPPVPSWWNTDQGRYAYGYWSADIESGEFPASPPNNATHWSSNYLSNTAFTASIGIGQNVGTVTLSLGNQFDANRIKDIYVYITGTTNSTETSIDSTFNPNGEFAGFWGGRINPETHLWDYKIDGSITPQPNLVGLTLTVPGMTSVTNIWVGEQCIPEPATMSLLGFGILSLIRRKK